MISMTLVKILRLIARIWSLIRIGFILTMFIGEALSGEGVWPTSAEWLGLALFPSGVLLGLLLAWWREGIGGAVALLSLVGFYLWNWLQNGRWPEGPFFVLVAAPGLLFLICSLLERPRRPSPTASF